MPEDVKTRMRKTIETIPEQFYPPPVFNQIITWSEPSRSLTSFTVLQTQLDFLADEIESLKRKLEK